MRNQKVGLLVRSTQTGVSPDLKKVDSPFTLHHSLFTIPFFFLFSLGLAQSDWTWRNPTPTGYAISPMTWTGELLVGVGGRGNVITSPDGVEWTVHKTGIQPGIFLSVAWSGSRLVAVGAGGRIMTSDDAVNWTMRIPDVSVLGLSNTDLFSVIWTGAQFVAVGDGNDTTIQIPDIPWIGVVLTSPDGIEWTRRDAGVTSGYLLDMAWSEQLKMLVAVGSYERILTSPDGVDWTVRNEVEELNQQLQYVTWAGSRFVTGTGEGVVYASEDGLTWTRDATDLDLWEVIWTDSPDSGGLGWVGLTGAGIYNSSDGISWSLLSDEPGGSRIAWTGEQLVVTSSISYTSPDGVTWTKHGRSVTSRELYDVTWVSGVGAVAVGREAILTSSDGVEWTLQQGASTLNQVSLLSVAWSQEAGFVAAGFGGVLLTSEDAGTWERHDVGAFNDCITWMGDNFIMAGWGDTIRISPDGVNWTTESKGYPALVQGMAWTGEQVVAVGEAGAILSSPDGVEWTVQDSGTGGYLYDVVWTGEQLVAVGSGGRVVTSSDGITWTERNSETDESLLSVTYSENWLVAVGRTSGNSSSGMAYASSDDGVTWHAYPTSTFNTLHSVTWTGERFIAVGYDGNILTAPEDEPLFVQRPHGSFVNNISLRTSGDALFFSLPPGQGLSGTSPEVSTVIYTLSGQRLLADKQALSGSQGTLSIGHLPPGPYLLELMVGGKRYNRGFTVVR